MDMCQPYTFSTAVHVPKAEQRIAFDRFHVIAHISQAVDEVRRRENRELVRQGDCSLKRTKYLWLKGAVRRVRVGADGPRAPDLLAER